jgi:hypothetical protein
MSRRFPPLWNIVVHTKSFAVEEPPDKAGRLEPFPDPTRLN